MNHTFDRIRFGVNYVPSKKWWYSWNDFHPDELARDLDAISKLGADHIRMMLIWPYFQPNRTYVSAAHLDRLEVFMELARERKLDVCVTMLTGWLSGWAFKPSYDTTGFSQFSDFYRSSWFMEPAELFFRKCAERLNQHPNFLGFDLGNEINCCWKTADLEEGAAWMKWILDLCETLSPQGIHVNGVDHNPWFLPHTFSPATLAQRPQLVAIHAWIEFTNALKLGGPADRVCTHLAPAMAALVRAYAGDPQKPVWLQEFGASTHWIKTEEIPVFLESAVRAAIKGGICWVTWWASHDIRQEFDFPVIEYDLGLLDVENRIKAEGKVFQRMAREFAGKTVVSAPILDTPPLPKMIPEDIGASFENTWRWLKAVLPTLP